MYEKEHKTKQKGNETRGSEKVEMSRSLGKIKIAQNENEIEVGRVRYKINSNMGRRMSRRGKSATG